MVHPGGFWFGQEHRFWKSFGTIDIYGISGVLLLLWPQQQFGLSDGSGPVAELLRNAFITVLTRGDSVLSTTDRCGECEWKKLGEYKRRGWMQKNIQEGCVQNKII